MSFSSSVTKASFMALIVICIAAFSASVMASTSSAKGGLFLVSMGTGDPDNMSLRAHKVIESADIFFCMGGKDRAPELTKGKPVYNAEHGLFGKDGARPHVSDEKAESLRAENRKIIRDAVAAGKKVVILDNGDPTIFGPHIGYMKEFADLKPVIVPGVSSFNSANAALKTSIVGGKARAVMLTSGSVKDGREEFLAKAINDGVTLALFMVRDLEQFITALNAHVSAEMPVAIVVNAGSSSEEKVIIATMGTVLETIKGEKLGPYLLYIGEAVAR